MSSVCLYFHVHQPYRVRRYRVFDIGHSHEYWTDPELKLSNKEILKKVARKCYLPTNAVLLDLLKHNPRFRVSFSITGIVLEQLAQFSPEALSSFQELITTGRAEVIDETYYHSLSFLYSKEEFTRQVRLHRRKIKEIFGVTPKIFRNTELIYNNELAAHVAEMGYKGILMEGADHILGWRSPNFLYSPPGPAGSKLKLLLKNYRLSDDIAFRFGEKTWKDYPLTAEKFASWVSATNGSGDIVNLFMDYETFGEHQWEDTGIFEFLKALPDKILAHPDNRFVTPSEAVASLPSVGQLDVPNFVSWADVERDLSAWLSNPMQHDALSKLYALESDILKSKKPDLISDWRRLQASDHFYYMCTKWFADGDVHKYFNPYDSPYEAFISYINVLQDLRLRLDEKTSRSSRPTQRSRTHSSPNPNL